MWVWVVDGPEAAVRVGEVHVDFEEEEGEQVQGCVADVFFAVDYEFALGGCWEVEDEPEALSGC